MIQRIVVGIVSALMVCTVTAHAANETAGVRTETVHLASCADYKSEVSSHYIYDALVKQKDTAALQKYKTAMAWRSTDCKKIRSTFSGNIPPLNTGYFLVANTKAVSRLTGEQKKLILSQTNLYGAIVMRQMNSMITSGFLSLDDKRALEKKITFTYVKSCNDPLRGNTTFKEWRRDGAFMRNEIVGINLKIFLCFQKSFIDHVTDDFIHVATHELAHYYNFIRDPDPFYFSTICRDKGNKKSACTDSNFVTSYAASDEKEDYAETFAYRYLNKYPAVKSGTILAQKKKYFDTRYALIRQ